MTISKKKETPNCTIYVNGEKIKQVMTFRYLGSWVTSDTESESEIKTKIGMTKAALATLKHILTSKH